MAYGSWIFVSTACTYLAGNLDRLCVGQQLEELADYHIAAMLARMPTLLVMSLGHQWVFPLFGRLLRANRSISDVYPSVHQAISGFAGYVVAEGPKPTLAAAATATERRSPDPLLEASEAPADADIPTPSTEVTTPDAQQRGTNWAHLVAQGKFREVLADAQRRGVDQILASAPLADLAALSDAARYARNGALAKKALLAERQRFPNSRAASDAAFLLGRLAEDSGGGAMAWYDRYLAKSPNGPYASQALGRKMMLSFRDGGPAGAEPLAKEYLERYPNGPYASAARKLVNRPAP